MAFETVSLGPMSSSSKSLVGKEDAAISEASVNSQEPRNGSETVKQELGETRYSTMQWWSVIFTQVSFLMFAEIISLGVFALPKATATVGFFPSIFFLVVFGGLATYAGYVIGQFKLRHMEVRNVGDCGSILLAPWGPRAAAVASTLMGYSGCLFLIFIMAAHVLFFGITLNEVTDRAACSILFLASGAILSFTLCLPPKLAHMTTMSVLSMISVFGAVFTTMAGVSILPNKGGDGPLAIAKNTAVFDGVVALLDIVLAYSGNVAFFVFISEMREPRDYPKALYTLQGTATGFYIIVAIFIYYFAGLEVSSPSMASAGPVLKKIAFYIAIPTIVVAGVINGHVACKALLREWRRTPETQTGWNLWMWWIGANILLWTLAWVLAESVPNFSQLLALVSALLGMWFTYGLGSTLWFFMNHGRYTKSWKQLAMSMFNAAILLTTAGLMGVGLYACGVAVKDSSAGSAWTCKLEIH